MKDKQRLVTIKVTEEQHNHWMRCCKNEGSNLSTKFRMLMVATFGQPEQPVKESK